MPLLRPAWLALAVSAVLVTSSDPAWATAPAVRATFVEACPAGAGPGDAPVAAIGLRADGQAATGPTQVAILVDTSAKIGRAHV